MRAFLLTGAALMMAFGAQAADPDELGCIEKGYSPEQRAQIDALLPKVDLLAGGQSPFAAELGMLIGGVAKNCAASLEWDSEEIRPAVLHEFGRVTELGVRRHGPLTADEVSRIDAALATGDRAALWSALEAQVAAGMMGQADSTPPDSADVLGAFMIETGVDLQGAKPGQVGAFLATLAMQRVSRRAFAGQ